MKINPRNPWLLLLVLFSTCLLVTYARRGGGGFRTTYSRPAPAPSYRPPPAPVYRPPPAAPAPAYKPPTAPASKPSSQTDKQPAYNPNYKPGDNAPAGPPPPYSPAGQPVPNAPVGPPPPYRPNQPPLGNPPPGVQPPPYPGQPARPNAYPHQPAPYPVQPGFQSHPNQPGVNRPYPVQPGYPGGVHQQPGITRPYPPQPLGGNVWQPHQGMPAPVYMNYGGIPTGTNMHTKPHKKKGFIGSLMSVGKHKSTKQHKYQGSYPSPYGVGGMGLGGMSHMGGSFLGKYGRSAAMYTIFPYMAAKSVPQLWKPRFGFMPMFMPRYYVIHHHHHYHRHDNDDVDKDSEFAKYFDVYEDKYVGSCQRPIRNEHSEINCNATYNEIQCDVECKVGYRFPLNVTSVPHKCWHVTGVWSPKKNFPDCEPNCGGCKNGGRCIRPDVCKCPAEFRGNRCQFRKLNFLDCDARKLTKGNNNVGWVCSHSKNETSCTFRCKPPAEFECPAADEYKCIPTGEWTPNSLPHCAVKEKKDENSDAENRPC